jgi:hypothetical protein
MMVNTLIEYPDLRQNLTGMSLAACDVLTLSGACALLKIKAFGKPVVPQGSSGT